MKRYGPYKNNSGYWFWIDYDGLHRKTVLVSREVLATKLGRPLRTDEHAHHISGNLDDNSPENLELRDRTEHCRAHGAKAWLSKTPQQRRAFVLSGSRAQHRRRMDRDRKRAAKERARLAGGAVAERQT